MLSNCSGCPLYVTDLDLFIIQSVLLFGWNWLLEPRKERSSKCSWHVKLREELTSRAKLHRIVACVRADTGEYSIRQLNLSGHARYTKHRPVPNHRPQ